MLAIDLALTRVCLAADALTVEAREGADMGFTGKQAIHPAQVPFIYAAFAPRYDECKCPRATSDARLTATHANVHSPQVQHKAERIKKEFEAAIEAGRGAFSLDGIMIDKVRASEPEIEMPLSN